MTPAALQHLDHLVAGEAAGGRGPDAEDVVACTETAVLIGGEGSERANQRGFR